jgi:hypothetical protein
MSTPPKSLPRRPREPARWRRAPRGGGTAAREADWHLLFGAVQARLRNAAAAAAIAAPQRPSIPAHDDLADTVLECVEALHQLHAMLEPRGVSGRPARHHGGPAPRCRPARPAAGSGRDEHDAGARDDH